MMETIETPQSSLELCHEQKSSELLLENSPSSVSADAVGFAEDSELIPLMDSMLLAEEETPVPSQSENPKLLPGPSEVESLPAALCDEELLRELAEIPNRMAFKIGDVADLLGLKQHVLRYWESEFEVLKPRKAQNNQRMYTRRDVENALIIRKLLHRDRFSIEGARNAMKDLKKHVRKEVKKERAFTDVVHRFDTLQGSIQSLLSDIHRLKIIVKGTLKS